MKLPKIWARRLTVVHASLKDKATPPQVAAHVQRVVKRIDPHLIATTEAQKGDTRATKPLLGVGYNAVRAGGRMVVWKTKRLRLMRTPKWVRLTFVYSGDEAWRDLHVAVFDFEDRANGLLCRVIVPHFASGVEMGDGWKPQNANGRKVHDVGWPLVRGLAAAADTEGYEPIVLGDGNLNFLRDAWRKYVGRRLGSLRLVWAQVPLPKRGTHGRRPGRLIDFVASTMPATKAWVSTLKRWRPMDHDPIVAVLNLTPAIKRRARPVPKKK